MADHIIVTKKDDHNFNVKFASAVPGPGGKKAGDTVPTEWLQAALDYFHSNKDAAGKVNAKAQKKITPLW
jgi:hypothetical protein